MQTKESLDELVILKIAYKHRIMIEKSTITKNSYVTRKPQYKDVYRRTIEVLQRNHMLKLIDV